MNINYASVVAAQSLGFQTIDELLAWLTAAAHQRGTATLSGGTITISNAVLTANSVILCSYNTAGANADILSAPAASRNISAKTFVIQSTNPLDTSTVDWIVVG